LRGLILKDNPTIHNLMVFYGRLNRWTMLGLGFEELDIGNNPSKGIHI
jgi:hypothetical protein